MNIYKMKFSYYLFSLILMLFCMLLIILINDPFYRLVMEILVFFLVIDIIKKLFVKATIDSYGITEKTIFKTKK